MEHDIDHFLKYSYKNAPAQPSLVKAVKAVVNKKISREKKEGACERSAAKRPCDRRLTSAQYNLFTDEYYDLVDRNGNIVAVKMTESTKRKYKLR